MDLACIGIVPSRQRTTKALIIPRGSDCVNAQADLCRCCSHVEYTGFLMNCCNIANIFNRVDIDAVIFSHVTKIIIYALHRFQGVQ